MDFRLLDGKLGEPVKEFYARQPVGDSSGSDGVALMARPYIGTRARVAVYDGPASAPLVQEVAPAPAREYIEQLSSKVFSLARERGGPIPYTVIREIAENLMHAGFAEPVVSILDDGHTIRFSDQGPGIADKSRALLPGFTTATETMKDVIRGVGSGLPIVSDFLALTGGSISIEDNLNGGAVVTIAHGKGDGHRSGVTAGAVGSLPPKAPAPSGSSGSTGRAAGPEPSPLFDAPSADPVRLSTRQKHVLALVLETGTAGPSIVSRELGVGLSTAYRDLASLEDLGLITADGGKRTLTPDGAALLSKLMNPGRDA